MNFLYYMHKILPLFSRWGEVHFVTLGRHVLEALPCYCKFLLLISFLVYILIQSKPVHILSKIIVSCTCEHVATTEERIISNEHIRETLCSLTYFYFEEFTVLTAFSGSSSLNALLSLLYHHLSIHFYQLFLYVFITPLSCSLSYLLSRFHFLLSCLSLGSCN